MLFLMATGLDQVTAFGAVATCLNNLGPGLGEVANNFVSVSDEAKWLFAVDELCGFCMACAMVQPDKKIAQVKVKSVKKKWKDKRFAAGVDRSIIEKGAAMLGVELSELISDTIAGMQAVADTIGLKGQTS